MPDKTKPTAGNRFGVTAVVFIAALLFFLVSFPYQWHAESAAAQRERPQLYANTVVKALREFRERRGGWPDKLRELSDARVWGTMDEVQLGEDGRNMVVSNYYYRYFPLPGDAVAVWAVPVGKYADLGSTHYLLAGRDCLRHWMGPPLKKEDAKLIVPYPTPAQFALLMMKEQVVEKQAEKKRGLFGL